MYAFNRISRNGLQYQLMELPDGTTRIRTLGKEIIVNHDILRLQDSWYKWIVLRISIQNAFDYLSADEREFLQSGFTLEDWNKIFPPEMEEK